MFRVGVAETSYTSGSFLAPVTVDLTGKIHAQMPITFGIDTAYLIVDIPHLEAFFQQQAAASVNVSCVGCSTLLTRALAPPPAFPRGIIGILLMRPMVFINSIDRMLLNVERALLAGAGVF